jgi:uncharacterized protein YaaR (DUF327 family)
LFLKYSKPSGTLTTLLIDVLFDILHFDPNSNLLIKQLEGSLHSQLTDIYKSSVFLLKLLYSSQYQDYGISSIHSNLIQLFYDWQENNNRTAGIRFQPYRPLVVDPGMMTMMSGGERSYGGVPSLSIASYCLMILMQSMIKQPYQPLNSNSRSSAVNKEREVSASLSAKSNKGKSKNNQNDLSAITDTSVSSVIERPEEMIKDCQDVVTAFVKELINRCTSASSSSSITATDKEQSSKYYSLLSFVTSELLSSCASPLWPCASLLIEKIIIGLLLQLRKFIDMNESKKISSQMNQLLDVLAGITESLHRVYCEIQTQQSSIHSLLSKDGGKRRKTEVSSEKKEVSDNSGSNQDKEEEEIFLKIRNYLIASIRSKWQSNEPLWLKSSSSEGSLLSPSVRGSYWNDASFSSSSTAASPLKKKTSFSSSSLPTTPSSRNQPANDLLPYLIQLDSMMDINVDIDETLTAIINNYDILPDEKERKKALHLLTDGSIDVSTKLLPVLDDKHDLLR